MNYNWLSDYLIPFKEPRQTVRYIGISAGAVAAAVLLAELCRLLGFNNAELVSLFVLSTFLVARFTAGYLLSILAAVINTFLYDYFITDPRFALSYTPGFPLILIVMLVIVFITRAVTIQKKKQALLAEQREKRAELIQDIGQQMRAAETNDSILALTAKYLEQSLRVPVHVFLGDPLHNKFFVSPADGEAPGADVAAGAREVFKNPHVFKGESYLCPNAYYIPILANRSALGVICLHMQGNAPDSGHLSFANILAGQAASAIQLNNISEERAKTLMLAETEKTRSNLLRSISHDIRTPLTGILSASSIMLDKTGDPLAADIKDNSEWLIHMVENLLMITRIKEGENKVKKKPEIAEEVMGRAVTIVRNRFPDCNIMVKASDEPVIVPMDAMLISQVFINLLENAVKNSPGGTPVFFDMDITGSAAYFIVSDMGPGIRENIIDRLLEMGLDKNTKSVSVDSVTGMGLGLSICNTIIKAHGGRISAKNKVEGGARFVVRLPMDA